MENSDGLTNTSGYVMLRQRGTGQVLCYTNLLFGKYFTNRTTTMLTFSFFLFLLQASICDGSTGVCCPSSSLWLSYVSPSVCQYPQRVPHQRLRQGWQPSKRCSKKCPWWTGKTLKQFILQIETLIKVLKAGMLGQVRLGSLPISTEGSPSMPEARMAAVKTLLKEVPLVDG